MYPLTPLRQTITNFRKYCPTSDSYITDNNKISLTENTKNVRWCRNRRNDWRV